MNHKTRGLAIETICTMLPAYGDPQNSYVNMNEAGTDWAGLGWAGVNGRAE
jgi:hypothetical protein